MIAFVQTEFKFILYSNVSSYHFDSDGEKIQTQCVNNNIDIYGSYIVLYYVSKGTMPFEHEWVTSECILH